MFSYNKNKCTFYIPHTLLLLDLLQWNNNKNHPKILAPHGAYRLVSRGSIKPPKETVGAERIKNAEILNLSTAAWGRRVNKRIWIHFRPGDLTDCKQKPVVNENKRGDL